PQGVWGDVLRQIDAGSHFAAEKIDDVQRVTGIRIATVDTISVDRHVGDPCLRHHQQLVHRTLKSVDRCFGFIGLRIEKQDFASNLVDCNDADKIGCKVLFLNPQTYETETAIDGFQRTVHELLVMPEAGVAYVPIYGDGIHGRNPNPGHTLHVIDLLGRKVAASIDLSPYIAPHTLRLALDGLIYITCENSAVVVVIDPKTNRMIDAINSGSTNGHRLAIAPDGQRLYTDNEE